MERLGGESLYRLGYPNREVRQSLNRTLLRYLAEDPSRTVRHGIQLYRLLRANDFEGMEELFRSFFAGIPYQWHVRRGIADYEGYYASVFHTCFVALGLDVRVEDASSRGRVDMAVRFHGNVYLFEFKVVKKEATGTALAQLRAKAYGEKYRHLGEPIHRIGVEFSKATRNVVAFETERA